MPQRYFVNEFNGKITNQDAHHIKNVMRMKVNQEVIVCHNKQCFLVKITKIDQDILYETIKELPKTIHHNITLIQGLPKHPKTEFIVKYATTFGVSEIIFVTFKRSIAKEKNKEQKESRIQTIAKEAAELSHRSFIPKISFINKIDQIKNEFDLVIIADENSSNLEIPSIDEKLKAAIIIGPEGGLDDYERNYFNKNYQTVFVSLGNMILPTEVASLKLLALLSHKTRGV